jgi:arylformamidase
MFRPSHTFLYDLTLTISPTTLTYPEDPSPAISRTTDLSQGDSLTASHLSLNCHVGTHVDAPAHFIAHGATLEELGLLHRDRFTESFCVVSPDAARYLLSKTPRSIGFDYYSLDPHQTKGAFPTHRILAQSNIPVFVCLDLSEVPPGRFIFCGFPLRLAEVEASPVRAILMKEM